MVRYSSGCHLKKTRKMLIRLCLVLLAALQGTAVTYTYVRHAVHQENLLKAHSVRVGIIETPDDGFLIDPGSDAAKKVKFSNEGSAAVFLRVSYAETWQDEEGNWLENAAGYSLPHWTGSGTGIDSDLWFDGGDGWYYYKKVLRSGGATEPIMDYVTFSDSLPGEYGNGRYDLVWAAEAVQCSGDKTITDGRTVNEAALDAAFGRRADISDLQVVNGEVTAGTVEWK